MCSRIVIRKTAVLGLLLFGIQGLLFAQLPLKKPFTMTKHNSHVDYTLTAAAAEKMGLGEKEVRNLGIHHNQVWVDLGLSVKWAECNMGAKVPSDGGTVYAWGETAPKNKYDAESSQTWKKRFRAISGKPEYDPACKDWKGKWRMPTDTEISELIFECTWKLDTLGQQPGYRVVGKNGQSIFLPFTGRDASRQSSSQEPVGLYWSASPHKKNNGEAFSLLFTPQSFSFEWGPRFTGRSIRPVLSE